MTRVGLGGKCDFFNLRFAEKKTGNTKNNYESQYQ